MEKEIDYTILKCKNFTCLKTPETEVKDKNQYVKKNIFNLLFNKQY